MQPPFPSRLAQLTRQHSDQRALVRPSAGATATGVALPQSFVIGQDAGLFSEPARVMTMQEAVFVTAMRRLGMLE